MSKEEILDHLYEGHNCQNCAHLFGCKKKPKYSVCPKWESADLIDSLLKIVRTAYPTSIKDDLLKEYPMENPSDSIFYLKSKDDE